MTAPTTAPTTARRAGGMALVAVLGGLLLVSTIVFAMAFVATLDVMAARSSQTAVLADAQVEGALAVALAELAETAGTDPGGAVTAPSGALGPWPELGIGATVDVAALPERWDGNEVVTLLAETRVGTSRAEARAVVALTPAPRVLWRP
ncbi:MAG: hypothetical protein R6W77_03485 [Trueperaceae bacterium]